MVQSEIVNFLGLDCLPLKNEYLTLLIAQSMGPRILSLSLNGGENLLAELPDAVLDCPGSEGLHLYGGHRLWHAPEDAARTYQPDNTPPEVIPVENGCLLMQDVESKTGLQKSMEVRLIGNTPQLIVKHTITNHNLWAVTCAPWAITQLKTGGTAILPQSLEETGLLPNRSLVMWPYTDPSLPNIQWGKSYILFRASVDSPFKVGFPNPRGWLAYWLNGTLFVKRAKYEAQSAYFDFGSSSECYCNDRFIELETLAPITTLKPGSSIEHVETWELYNNVECPRDEKDVQALVEKLKLE